MTAFAKAIYILAKAFYRIADELSKIRNLYELELRSNGIVPVDTSIKDEVEISYGSMKPNETNLEGW